jgi:rRNA-processing protein FCF1
MKIIIDTNFILTLIKEKINLDISLKELLGLYEILVPEGVIEELKKISQDKKTRVVDREIALVSLSILGKFKLLKMENKDVDTGIVKFVLNNPEIVVATLDKELRSRILIKNSKVKFLIIRGKKRLVVQ